MEIRKKFLQPFFMGIAILLFVTWIGVPAAAKAYATKTIKVVEDKSKTYAFSNKIKKVKKEARIRHLRSRSYQGNIVLRYRTPIVIRHRQFKFIFKMAKRRRSISRQK